MIKPIVDWNNANYQLVSLGIDIVHKILSLEDCSPDVLSNPHISKTFNLAKEWNKKFIELVVTTKEGVKS